MIQNFNFNIKKSQNFSLKEKNFREKSLDQFNSKGFPNKKIEEWKFTDLNKIINDNFKDLELIERPENPREIKDLTVDFEHNSIQLINGFLNSSDLKYEDKSKIKISEYKQDFFRETETKNSLINLNDALYGGGFSLEVSNDYVLNKPLVVYNFFESGLNNKIINNKNRIVLHDNSKIDLIDIFLNSNEIKFMQNNFTSIFIGKKSSLKNYTIQGGKSNGLNYKYVKGSLNEDSVYQDYIFSSGIKFNRIDEDIDFNGERAECNILSALFVENECHQEIKTLINHLKPNCKSYQKIKNVLKENCKSAYQGKIFVKDIAQKTDAYQLSKALILDDSSEFDAKPELEIYADDVKCSHGSTSGSINEDSIYYLMTRGISRKDAKSLLTKAFLFEIVDSIQNKIIKKFIEKNLDRQIYGY